MMVDLDKNCDKNELNNIKTAIGYPPKSVLFKISYVIFSKLAQISKKLIILGVFYFRHCKVILLMTS